MTSEISTNVDERFLFEEGIGWDVFEGYEDENDPPFPQMLSHMRMGLDKAHGFKHRLLVAYDKTVQYPYAPAGYAIVVLNTPYSIAYSILEDGLDESGEPLSSQQFIPLGRNNPRHYGYVVDVRVDGKLAVETDLLNTLISRADALIRQHQIEMEKSHELASELLRCSQEKHDEREKWAEWHRNYARENRFGVIKEIGREIRKALLDALIPQEVRRKTPPTSNTEVVYDCIYR